MRQFLNGNTLYNNLRMLLTSRPIPILVVEGESDATLFEEKLGPAIPFVIFTSYGKPHSIEAARLSDDANLDRVMFLVDADFDRLTGLDATYPSESVILTEYYDLLCDVVMSTARPIISVIRTFSNAAKSTLDPTSILNLAQEVASSIGAFRYAAHVHGWPIDLSRFPTHLVLPVPGDKTDDTKIAEIIDKKSKPSGYSLPPEAIEITDDCIKEIDESYLVNSHDLLDAISHYCRTYGQGRVATKIEPSLILAIDSVDFQRLGCVQQATSWVSKLT